MNKENVCCRSRVNNSVEEENFPLKYNRSFFSLLQISYPLA